MVFKKNANYFAANLHKSQKCVIITLSPDRYNFLQEDEDALGEEEEGDGEEDIDEAEGEEGEGEAELRNPSLA
jgi:hypothetical protein